MERFNNVTINEKGKIPLPITLLKRAKWPKDDRLVASCFGKVCILQSIHHFSLEEKPDSFFESEFFVEFINADISLDKLGSIELPLEMRTKLDMDIGDEVSIYFLGYGVICLTRCYD